LCPASFLLILPSAALAELVYNGGRPIITTSIHLHVMRWTRFLHSTAGGLSTAIEIELRGIPTHAWDLSTADLLLDEFCWIEGIHPSTAERRDVFLLKAWRLNPHHIPLEMVLKIVEPHLAGCPHSGVRTLTYPISVRVAPFVQPSSTGDDSSPPPPPADEHRRRCRSRNRRQHLERQPSPSSLQAAAVGSSTSIMGDVLRCMTI